jgi:hypothetical protein
MVAGGGASTAQPGAAQPPETGRKVMQSDRLDLRADLIWLAML